jgi:hypothetical protein
MPAAPEVPPVDGGAALEGLTGTTAG